QVNRKSHSRRDKCRGDCTSVALCIGLGIMMFGCSSSTWEDAQQTDTYEAYQTYIDDNPGGEHIKEAKKRADARYWNAIETDTTARAFEEYLDKFPGGQFQAEAQKRITQLSGSGGVATEGQVTGSNIIIRSDHTTQSPSAGVVANEGTIVQILDRYQSGSSKEAILKHPITVVHNGSRINLSGGKAIRILEDHNDSVRASFSTPGF